MVSSSAQFTCSLDELEIELPGDIRSFLVHQYQPSRDGFDDGNTSDELSSILAALKRPPASTICRVNRILAMRDDVEVALNDILIAYPHLQLQKHALFDDVLCILPRDQTILGDKKSTMNYTSRTPDTNQETEGSKNPLLFSEWTSREERGWPMTHRVVVCDRFCAEAVLRGADIFVRGILAADANIQAGETVAVYADIRSPKETAVHRGLFLDRYANGRCLYLGLGIAECSRNEFFRSSHGVGIIMSKNPLHRVGPCLPSLSGFLQDKMMLQNLPSVLVGHTLDPQPHDTILDMCAAPGGKSAHLASLVQNRATIVSCDKSRKKVMAAKELFSGMGASCITPLVLDTTRCVNSLAVSDDDDDNDKGQTPSIQQILDSAQIDENTNLKIIQQFPPESFDRILLDPPCSALGLRPKLFVAHATLEELQKHASYQKKFVKAAVALLKPGGFMTYSTCTINSEENELMVRHILQEYPVMKLVPITANIGQAGLAGVGLTDDERRMVRRFDPHNLEADTMGFFLALFQKTDAFSVML